MTASGSWLGEGGTPVRATVGVAGLLVLGAILSGVLCRFELVWLAPVGFCLCLGVLQGQGKAAALIVAAASLAWWNVLVPTVYAFLNDLLDSRFGKGERPAYVLTGAIGALGIGLLMSIWDGRHRNLHRLFRLTLFGAAGATGFIPKDGFLGIGEVAEMCFRFLVWQLPVGLWLLSLRRMPAVETRYVQP